MKKGETSSMIIDAGDGKAAVEEKGNRSSHHIKVGMDFDPKTFKLHNQKAVDKNSARYRFYLICRLKLNFAL